VTKKQLRSTRHVKKKSRALFYSQKKQCALIRPALSRLFYNNYICIRFASVPVKKEKKNVQVGVITLLNKNSLRFLSPRKPCSRDLPALSFRGTQNVYHGRRNVPLRPLAVYWGSRSANSCEKIKDDRWGVPIRSPTAGALA